MPGPQIATSIWEAYNFSPIGDGGGGVCGCREGSRIVLLTQVHEAKLL